jgi:hypothetical protein
MTKNENISQAILKMCVGSCGRFSVGGILGSLGDLRVEVGQLVKNKKEKKR